MFIATLICVIPGTASAAVEVSVSELIEKSEDLAGSEVTLDGELVGDYGFRDDGWMWTQINGDAYVRAPIRDGGEPVGGNSGIAVRMPTVLGEGLDPVGRYRNRGPIVEVTGIWKHHDPARQGESYVEVTTLTVVEPGRPMHEAPQWVVTIVGLAFLVGSLALWAPSIHNAG